jgi:hypothetical protein
MDFTGLLALILEMERREGARKRAGILLSDTDEGGAEFAY